MKLLRLSPEGPLLASPADASTLIGAAWGQDVDAVAVPVSRLPDAFFDLSTGLLGEVVQRLTNHRLSLVVVGDVRVHLARSQALQDFAREGQVRFVADEVALESLT